MSARSAARFFLTPFLVSTLLVPLASPARSGDLRVLVAGVRRGEGSVRVAAFASAADWEGNRRFAEAVAAAAGDRVEVHIPDPPPGTYGIAAYQDLDADGVLSKSWLGVPREPYGFSNGARGVLGPPAFDEIRFPVADAPFALRVELE